MSEDTPCFQNPQPECLSEISEHIDPAITDHVFSMRGNYSEDFECLYKSWWDVQDKFGDHLPHIADEEFCFPDWDGWSCWHIAYSGMNLSHPCPDVIGFLPDINLTRTCDAPNGWSKADYSVCLDDEYRKKVQCEFDPERYSHCMLDTDRTSLALILRDIYFYGGIASLILLSIALLIFCCFKSLQCPRVHIHKNLLVSLMLQCVVHIVVFEPYVDMDNEERVAYINIGWLCKTLFTLSNYTYLTNIFWAFVEGLFLYSRISIAVFSTETPYWLFYLIGWGLPAVFTVSWALCMHLFHLDQQCWRHFVEYGYFWILAGPIVAAVVANTIFLICIIRILVTKLHTAHSAEHVQVRKAMKATIVLLPLLSITTAFYVWSPDIKESPSAHYAYRIVNAILQVSQGIFVSVLFCYFNGEVRAAMMKYWNKWRIGAFRYRNSRASSVCVTQSELLAASNRRQSHSSYLSTDNHYSNNHSTSAPVSAV